ncbi:MAG: hypothetical protein PHU85_01970 [Phycisphaerae bacterium]|nr:hypothetical protein [Phycisphaerae bacterium]
MTLPRGLITGVTARLPGVPGDLKKFDPVGLGVWPHDSITVTLALPNRHTHPNQLTRGKTRLAAIIRAKEIKADRRSAADWTAYMLQGCTPPRWESANVHAVFYHRTKARRDPTNLSSSLKHVLDGIADAGVVVNDRVLSPPTVEDRIDRERPRVEITITQAASVDPGERSE